VAKAGPSDRYARIYRVVRRIPRGRVATYGQVAELADLPGCARQVGYALHALSDDIHDETDDEADGETHGEKSAASAAAVPWQRVVNARGEISRRSSPGIEPIQQQLLEAEGVEFDARGRLDLSSVRWAPRSRKRPEESFA
jgi:methylated-DNA-protein-cysteine methyltransferase-like protein